MADAAREGRALSVMVVVINGGWLLAGASLAPVLRDPRRSRIANVLLAVALVVATGARRAALSAIDGLRWPRAMPSTRALLLVRHAPTSATRAAAFPADEALDPRGRAAAGRLAAVLPARAEALTSPARSCRETADAAGLEARVEATLADVDYGAWAGRTLDDVRVGEPDAAAAWLSDPDARPHGGETLRELAGRVEAWLATQAGLDGRAVAITHAAVVRAAVVHALGAPPAAFWRIDVPPLAVTELHARSGRWTLARLSCGGGDRRR